MVVGAVRVVTTKNIVHAALWLVIVLAGVAGLFILLAAEFIAITQVLVYIGAIVVLFLFGIMLTRAPHGPSRRPQQRRSGRSPCVVGALPAGVIGYALSTTSATTSSRDSGGQTTAAGHRLASSRTYLLPFEVVSVLLLAALIGAIVAGEAGLTDAVNQFLFLGAILFCIGVYGVLARRNGVLVLMSIELILNSVNINLVAFGAARHSDVTGQVFALFIIAIAAAEVGVGLAIVLMLYRNRRSIDIDDVDR